MHNIARMLQEQQDQLTIHFFSFATPPHRYYNFIIKLKVNFKSRGGQNIIERITFIKIAQQTGFTIPEIGVLLQGFETLPTSERWEEMAREKRAQLEEKKKQINSMIQILDDGLNCKCLTWSECFIKIKNTGTCS